MQRAHSIVPKPWGWEYCAFDNGKAAVWILHVARGRKTSFHCHPNKDTRLVVLHGNVKIRTPALKDDKYGMNPLEHVFIPRGVFHQTQHGEMETASQDGAFVMEIEEPSDKGDIIRENDSYGRAGKPIESETVKFEGEILQLSPKPVKAMGYTFKIEKTLGGPVPDLMLNVGGEILGIYKENEKKVSDWTAEFVQKSGIKHVFGVTGGGSMHLNDSFRIFFHANHHEQASAFAAEAYSRICGLGCALVTTGPGGTNSVTGVASAWVDSIPVIFISGQVTTNQLMEESGVRQKGIQETDIVSIVRPITKYAVTVKRAEDVRYCLEQALWTATHGRKGPVWVDIPLDIQGKLVDWGKLKSFTKPEKEKPDLSIPVDGVYDLLKKSERPVLILGYGVRLSGAANEATSLCQHLGIPVITSWTASDILSHEEPLHIGHCGIFGDRASNFTVQNSDLLLVLGSRLSIGMVGYDRKTFARKAKVVHVDIDEHETEGSGFPINADCKDFIESMLQRPWKWIHGDWRSRCSGWKEKYPVVGEHRITELVNSFHFIDLLSEHLGNDDVVITDMGTAFTCTFQTARMRKGQRWITSPGHAPMGWGLPGAIGAAYATGGRVVCIVGDGSLQFNIQELQTIVSNKLPIIIFVINNGGYLTMKHTQVNHFGRFVGADKDSGVSCPDTWKIAQAYGIPKARASLETLNDDVFIALNHRGPYILEIMMDPMQQLIPRSSSQKLPDGSIVSKPLEDLFPFLPRDEFKKQMIVQPMETL